MRTRRNSSTIYVTAILNIEDGIERFDTSDTTDADSALEQYHRRCGIIVATVEDDASELAGDDRDNVLYRVEFDDGEQQDFRLRSLRPASN